MAAAAALAAVLAAAGVEEARARLRERRPCATKRTRASAKSFAAKSSIFCPERRGQRLETPSAVRACERSFSFEQSRAFAKS